MWDRDFESRLLQQRVTSEPWAARLIGRILLRATALEDLDDDHAAAAVGTGCDGGRSYRQILLAV
jgi:hypothetical protein